MRALFILIFLIKLNFGMTQQNTLPYAEIPDYYEEYTSGTVLARLIDGLGYRYYWASHDLRQEDLDFMPSEDGQSTIQTIEHIYNLSSSILKTIKGKPIERGQGADLDYAELRSRTLNQLREASKLVSKMSDNQISQLQVVFKRGDKTNPFPLWNLINGMISDAIYHTGQIVSFRRTTGNPIDSRVSVFMGKNRN